MQGRLEEAVLELRHTKGQVADLQIVVEKGNQDLRDMKTQCKAKQEQLKTDNLTTSEELKAVRSQLDIATRDLSNAMKDKESLEVCLMYIYIYIYIYNSVAT